MKSVLAIITILAVCGNMAMAVPEFSYSEEYMPYQTPQQRWQQRKEENYLRIQHANSTSDYFQSYQNAKPTVHIQDNTVKSTENK